MPLMRFAILSETLQQHFFFAVVFAAMGILLTIAGIGLWHLKKWAVILCAVAGTIFVSSFWFSLVDALLSGWSVEILSNGVLALFFSIGLVRFTILLWQDIKAG